MCHFFHYVTTVSSNTQVVSQHRHNSGPGYPTFVFSAPCTTGEVSVRKSKGHEVIENQDTLGTSALTQNEDT
jgi:hypothetical protein